MVGLDDLFQLKFSGPLSWDTDRLESFFLSIARNIFAEAKFDRGPGLRISQRVVRSVFLNWEKKYLESFSFCLVCVTGGVRGAPLAGALCAQVPADAGGCRRSRGSVPSPYTPPAFFSSSSFLSILDSQISIFNFSSPRLGYDMSLNDFFFPPLFPTGSSRPAVLAVSDRENLQLVLVPQLRNLCSKTNNPGVY